MEKLIIRICCPIEVCLTACHIWLVMPDFLVIVPPYASSIWKKTIVNFLPRTFPALRLLTSTTNFGVELAAIHHNRPAAAHRSIVWLSRRPTSRTHARTHTHTQSLRTNYDSNFETNASSRQSTYHIISHAGFRERRLPSISVMDLSVVWADTFTLPYCRQRFIALTYLGRSVVAPPPDRTGSDRTLSKRCHVSRWSNRRHLCGLGARARVDPGAIGSIVWR